MEILSLSENDTIDAARGFAAQLQAPCMVALSGTLGMGKSVFARSLIRTLTGNPDEEVPSPTFTLVQTYDTAKGPLWHFDLYRLRGPEEIFELGWDEAMEGGIVLVEWPERLGPYAPQEFTRIDFEKVPGRTDARLIRISQNTRIGV